ncbi:MAG TPA: hypothetical protein VJM33_11710 [Microthrixaceae bacterium]|nr:hypothetical protein [Microthrixaceae bacterium]
MRTGAYPGSFDPPTVAHVAIADAARVRHGLDRVDLVVSISAIDKEHVVVPSLDDRVAVLEALARRLGWMGVVVSDRRLIVDLAEGYDLVVMGADKWAQVNDATYYGSVAARDEAVARLPPAAVVPRPPYPVPVELRLPLGEADIGGISSTRARSGERHLMVPEAAELDERTGAWTDPERYRSR